MNQKAQEEIVGFVLIVVLIAVVFLVFLGISVRQGTTTTELESTDISQFLESTMEFTTNCSVSFIPDYATVGELLRECYEGTNCLSSENTCDTLNSTLTNALIESWTVDPEGAIKGYSFTSVYRTNSTSQESEFITIETGNCDGPIRGATYLAPAFPGKIESTLTICR